MYLQNKVWLPWDLPGRNKVAEKEQKKVVVTDDDEQI